MKESIYIKNTYALKTPRIVVKPFIYGVECVAFATLNMPVRRLGFGGGGSNLAVGGGV